MCAAGFDPVDDAVLDDNDIVLDGGQIKTISLKGVVDNSTRFIAALLPVAVKVNGTSVDTDTDPHFIGLSI